MKNTNQVNSSLEYLIGTESKALFFKKYWEKKSFFNRKVLPQKNQFSMIDLEDIFSSSRLTTSDLRLSSVDQTVPPTQYCYDTGAINIQKALFYFNRGNTIIIKNIENFNPWLKGICFNLIEELGNVKRIFVNLYLTPENSQGFFHHFDNEDVFILQVSGKKEWSLYDSPIPLPLEDQVFSMTATKPNKRRLKKYLLKQGEILYIPRGVIHEAKAQTNISCHLTISIVPFTWNDLMLEYQKELGRSKVSLRSAIPPKLSAMSAVKYLKVINKLQDKILKKVVSQFKSNYNNQVLYQFDMSGILSDRKILSNDKISITLNSKLYKGSILRRNVIELEVGFITIYLPVQALSIVEYILKHGICRIRDIPTKCTQKEKLEILDRLIRDSFIKIYSHGLETLRK